MGPTRINLVGHIAAKNVRRLSRSLRSLTTWSGSGFVFGDGGNGLVGGSGFVPSVDELLGRRSGAVRWSDRYSCCCWLPVRGRSVVNSVAIVWGAMGGAGTRLRVYFAFGIVFTLDDSSAPTRIWQPGRLALHARHAGLRWLDGRALPGGAGGLAGALLLGPRIGKFVDGESRCDPRRQHGVHDAGRADPLVRLGRLQPWFYVERSTSAARSGFFAYVALNHANIAAAAGVLGAVATAAAGMK